MRIGTMRRAYSLISLLLRFLVVLHMHHIAALQLSIAFQNPRLHTPATVPRRKRTYLSETEHSTSRNEHTSPLSKCEAEAVTEASRFQRTISDLVSFGTLEEALQLLKEREQTLLTSALYNTTSSIQAVVQCDKEAYIQLMQAYAKPKPSARTIRILRDLHQRMEQRFGSRPLRAAYDILMEVYSVSFMDNSGILCERMLRQLWTLYRTTKDVEYLPSRDSYKKTIAAYSHRGKPGAESAEALLREMEKLYQGGYQTLGPTLPLVNAVLGAWVRSEAKDAAQRCEAILQHLVVQLYESGRMEMRPNTKTYNTVIDCLATSQEEGYEMRAEALLYYMESLKDTNPALYETCQPDEVTFNTVLKCWSQSKVKGAARRAEMILHHMEKRFESGLTSIQPDITSYNTVLTAWVRSREFGAVGHAFALFHHMESETQRGNAKARPDIITYNILIGALVERKTKSDLETALNLARSMKQKARDGEEDLHPTAITYLSLMKALNNMKIENGPALIEQFLTDLELEYQRTGRPVYRPSIRLYYSALRVMGKNGRVPEKALNLLQRLERRYNSFESDVQPDTQCYNAVISAFGWSSVPERSRIAFEILEGMVSDFTSGKKIHVKPNLTTFNSVLNACAYDDPTLQPGRSEVVERALKTLRMIQSAAPEYGIPSQETYSIALIVLKTHMVSGAERTKLAEEIFRQCCDDGKASVTVISQLQQTIPWENLSAIMGSALRSKEGDVFAYEYNELPPEWVRNIIQVTPERSSQRSWSQRGPSKQQPFSARRRGRE